MTNTLETGGSERQFVTMARALDADKFSVSLGCLNPIGPFLSEVNGIVPFPVGGSLFGFRSWRSRLALARFLRRKRAAVAQSFDFYSNLMLIPAARFAGVPVVLGSHRQLGDLLTPWQFRTQNVVFRMCDRIVCNSAAAASRLRATGIRANKLTVIPNGLPAELFAAVAPALPPEEDVVRIGMIARMNHPVKRHDLFLRVAARLAPRFPHLKFVLVGDGPLRPALEALVRQLELVDRVVLLGDRRDIPSVLAALDVTVMPSSSESLSNAILESMAAGVPVVAAKVGGNLELVQDGKTGLLFAPGDEQQFAIMLESLVAQPELRKALGAAARAQAQAEYVVPRVRDRYQDLYRSLLAEKGWMDEPRAAAPASARGNGPGGTIALKKILQIGNWPPPLCGWAMGLVALRRELESRGWDCPVMNLNENRRVRNPECIDVQSGGDYLRKVWRHVRRGYAVQIRVNAESKKGYLLALIAMFLARVGGRPALLTYCGGHRQTFFPAPKWSFRWLAFALLLRIPTRIHCDSEAVKQVLLTTGIEAGKVMPVALFSVENVQFTSDLPDSVRDFVSSRDGVFFLYVCYRKEYMLDFLAGAMRQFRMQYPRIGFLLVGTSDKELELLRQFFRDQGLEDAVCITGAVSHDAFLTMLRRSLACIRSPMTDGVSSSVLESLALGVPVLGVDNGTRPEGVELWQKDDQESLLRLMTEAVENRPAMVARMPRFSAEDNTGKLADDVERACGAESGQKIVGGKSGVVTALKRVSGDEVGPR